MYFSYTYTFYILYLSSCLHTCTNVSVHTINIVQICKTFHDARMQHGKFCYLDSFGVLKILTFLSFVNKLWVKSLFAQVCHDMRRNSDEISCRMKLNSDVPNEAFIWDIGVQFHSTGLEVCFKALKWAMGAGYPLELGIPHSLRFIGMNISITPVCVRNFLDTFEYGIICFQIHPVLLECKGQ